MVELKRTFSNEKLTFGVFIYKGYALATLELPDRKNQRSISRIPAGTYPIKRHNSPKFGWCLKIFNVPNRDEILVHIGNTTKNTNGCVLVGQKANYKTESIETSKLAFDWLMKNWTGDDTITIKDC